MGFDAVVELRWRSANRVSCCAEHLAGLLPTQDAANRNTVHFKQLLNYFITHCGWAAPAGTWLILISQPSRHAPRLGPDPS